MPRGSGVAVLVVAHWVSRCCAIKILLGKYLRATTCHFQFAGSGSIDTNVPQ
jgi:hypothetical protein